MNHESESHVPAEDLPDHSPLGASSSDRWTACPASATLSLGIANESSVFAQAGTEAHDLADACLRHDVKAASLSNDPEMAAAVQIYLDFIASSFPDRDQGNSFSERFFYCPQLHKDFYGTADFAFIGLDSLHIIDFKYGAGIVVETRDNPQLLYYAAGMAEELGLWDTVSHVTVTIAQPRAFHPGGPIRSWSITMAALREWLDGTLLPAMTRASEGSKETKSGHWCRFCPARSRCPRLISNLMEMTTMRNKDGGAEALTPAQIGEYLELAETQKIFSKAVTDAAVQLLKSGEAVPGHHLGRARTNRSWTSEGKFAIVTEFGPAAFSEAKLKTPAQISGLTGGRAFVETYSTKLEGRETVAVGDPGKDAVQDAFAKS